MEKTAAQKLFDERFDKLNEAQQQAVNTIYGPVMVIAGPGTGKTEVLSMRIANLLNSEAQVKPADILCLTYTDEATNSMRRRLVQIVGTDAHKINIYTFHGFCNSIIQQYSSYFSHRNLEILTDLDRADLMHEILDELPQGHLLRKLSGNIYSHASKLNHLFDMMKREHLSSTHIAESVDLYIASLPERPAYIYQRNGAGYKKGDVKQKQLDEETNRMLLTKAGALLFETYEQKLKERGHYDYNDMILWVLEAFDTLPWLKQTYEERFQFILVDEFQDTNGAQNDLLKKLTDYWDDPNLFVVGDDDQSIYEFQGARIKNIVEFYERYKASISVIVLPHNYRSSQVIIDKAMATINNNQQRLINQIGPELGLNKQIVAAAERFAKEETVLPVVKVYNNTLQEEVDVVTQIEALQAKGVALKEIAVLYAQHKQANNIIALLDRKGIAYNVKRSANALEEPVVKQLLCLLQYVQSELEKPFSGEHLLFELLHAPYWGIEPADLGTIAIGIQNSKSAQYNAAEPMQEPGARPRIYWRTYLQSNALDLLPLQNPVSIKQAIQHIIRWEQYQLMANVPMLLEKIAYESGMMAYILKDTDHIWLLQVLYTFTTFVQEQFARNSKLNIAELLAIVDRMEVEQITLPTLRVMQQENGIHFYTAHSAKGNEFEYVFLIGCTKNYWEQKRGSNNQFKLPDTLTHTQEDVDDSYKTEVARRLFFVALTRAKKHLIVSYAVNDINGKALSASVFVDEISEPAERTHCMVETEATSSYLGSLLTPVPDRQIKVANATYIDGLLAQYRMSATALARYLRCPLQFYYESLLRVPSMPSDALAFGSAIHSALEQWFKDMLQKENVFPDRDQFLSYFERALRGSVSSFTNVQYERRVEQGRTMLGLYYDYYAETLHKDVKIEYEIPQMILHGVPVTAKIDKIELFGNKVNIIDYKTGNPDKAGDQLSAPNEKQPHGGDYWRQMVLYKMMLEQVEDMTWQVSLGRFDYLEQTKDKQFKQYTVPVFQQDEDAVKAMLQSAYGNIMDRKFDVGCGKPECRWCQFATNHKLLQEDAPLDAD